MHSDNEIGSLKMSGGIDLLTEGNTLTVNGTVELDGAILKVSKNETTSEIGELVVVGRVEINNGAEVNLAGGMISGNQMEIDVGGMLKGHGTVNLIGTESRVLSNDGWIAVDPEKLTIKATDASIDLDGVIEAGSLNVSPNSMLDIDGAISDGFGGEISLNHNSTLDIEFAWTLDFGTIEVFNGTVTGSFDADTSFLSGGEITQSGGNINVHATDGTLQFNAAFTQTGGTLTNNGTLRFDAPFMQTGGTLTNKGLVEFNADAMIGAGAIFAMPTTRSSITVGANVAVSIDQANFDADGVGEKTNVITVNNGGKLKLNLGTGADESLAGFIQLNGGELDVTTDFSLELNLGSRLDMTGGTFRMSATRTAEIGGEVVVNTGLESMLRTGGTSSTFEFQSASDVTLNGNLRLDSGITRIESGATFTGAGRLINAPGRRLEAEHQADIGVIVENQGLYSNSGSNVGRNKLHEFEQTASGTFRVDVHGKNISQFDRLEIVDQAQLAGSLELALGGGYVPVLGNTLNIISIISATGVVTGSFSHVIQPSGMPAGLMFGVSYNSKLVQLKVVEQVPGDYNLNGVVDAADYVVWRDTLGQLGAGLAADGNNSGSIDNADYDFWRARFGNTAQLGAGAFANWPAGANVPEPTTQFMLLMAILAQCLRRRAFA
jgi:hypothetical protein